MKSARLAVVARLPEDSTTMHTTIEPQALSDNENVSPKILVVSASDGTSERSAPSRAAVKLKSEKGKGQGESSMPTQVVRRWDSHAYIMCTLIRHLLPLFGG